jgi:hypothetical protein
MRLAELNSGMKPLSDGWDIESAEKALTQFSYTVAKRGRHYYESGQVISGAKGEHLNEFVCQVRGTAPQPYEVILRYGRSHWESLCSCPIGVDCKHSYAALLHLLKKIRASEGVRSTDGKDSASRSDRSRFLGLVSHGEKLSQKDRDFLERLELLYEACQEGRYPNSGTLRGLFPKWPESGYWETVQFAPKRKLSRLEFWHFLVCALRERRIVPPEIFGSANDTTPSAALIANWRREKEEELWRSRYERFGPGFSERSHWDYRWALLDKTVRLESMPPGEPVFRKLKQSEMINLITQYRQEIARIAPGAIPLVTEHLHECHYQYAAELPLTLGFAVKLGALLRLPDIRARTALPEGRSLHLVDEKLNWRMEEVADQPGDYRFRLCSNGIGIDKRVWIFPGPVSLYLVDDTLFEGPPPPVPLESAEMNPVIDVPKTVIESVAALPLVLNAKSELPAELARRIETVPVRPRIQACTGPFGDQIGIFFSVQCADTVTGRNIATYGELGWDRKGLPIGRSGDKFFVYAFPDLKPLHEALALLPATFDRSTSRWRVKHPKHSVGAFAQWTQSLPPEIEVEVSEDLSGVLEAPVEVELELSLSQSGNDWFDLQLALPRSEIEFSTEELRLLLQARTGIVRLESRRYRQVSIHVAERLTRTLEELGLNMAEILEEPQRLHLMHIRTLLENQLLPERFRTELERRVEEVQLEVRPAVPEAIRTSLRTYQVEGFHFLAYLAQNAFGGILADDMGLGKTAQALAWLAWLKTRSSSDQLSPSLVVCPKSVVDSWLEESRKFYPLLKIRALERTEIDPEDLNSEGVLVLNYTQLRLLEYDLRPIHWMAVLFDEGQYLKNASSQTAHAARNLQATHKLILTGTPIENHLLDLWSLFQCVMPGVLGTKASFQRRFQERADPTARLRLARRVRPFLLRRTKEEVAPELPERVEEDIRCAMEGEQEKLYRAELKLARQSLLKIKKSEELVHERFNLLTSLLRLRQICCHPALVDAKTHRDSPAAKLDALTELLEPLLSEGNKVLIFSQFVEMLKLIEARTNEFGCATFKLTGRTRDRGKVVQQFQCQDGAGIFLISLKAGGTGLNLAAASYVVLFDPWWNPAVENQAIDRTHRIGQVNTVFAYRLLIQNSIEDKIRRLQIFKSDLAKDVLGEENFGKALTLEDFRFLLS